LRMATGKFGATDRHAFGMLQKSDVKFTFHAGKLTPQNVGVNAAGML
jgi:hypothetical protein